MADAILSVSGIYAIRNTVNGKVYVGSSVNIKRRWGTHRHGLTRGAHHGVLLQRAWDKHGASAFVFEVLEYVSQTEYLLTREQFWIDALKSAKVGYNTAPFAGSTLGKAHGEAARLKMSASHKERLADPELLAERSRQLKVTFSTPERRAEQAEKAKAAWRNERFRLQATKRAVEMTKAPEWRKAHSEKIKSHWADPERRAAWCESMKGRVATTRKAVMLFGVRYESMTAAAAAHGRSRDWVKVRMVAA